MATSQDRSCRLSCFFSACAAVQAEPISSEPTVHIPVPVPRPAAIPSPEPDPERDADRPGATATEHGGAGLFGRFSNARPGRTGSRPTSPMPSPRSKAAMILRRSAAVGEIGLMQVRPSTAAMLGFDGDTTELAKPEVNIRYGVTYLARGLAAREWRSLPSLDEISRRPWRGDHDAAVGPILRARAGASRVGRLRLSRTARLYRSSSTRSCRAMHAARRGAADQDRLRERGFLGRARGACAGDHRPGPCEMAPDGVALELRSPYWSHRNLTPLCQGWNVLWSTGHSLPAATARIPIFETSR